MSSVKAIEEGWGVGGGGGWPSLEAKKKQQKRKKENKKINLVQQKVFFLCGTEKVGELRR